MKNEGWSLDGAGTALSIMGFLKNIAPLLMIVISVIDFVVFGIMEGGYYYQIYEKALPNYAWLIAIGIPAIVEGGRFTFLLAAVNNATSEHQSPKLRAVLSILGFVMVILICVYQVKESYDMCNLWAGGEEETLINNSMFYLFQFLIWFGLLVEVRLIMILFENL